jgi:hypothetical protein
MARIAWKRLIGSYVFASRKLNPSKVPSDCFDKIDMLTTRLESARISCEAQSRADRESNASWLEWISTAATKSEANRTC